MASGLAQELVDTILDFLYDDRESLLSSSLVARKWVPTPRYHIFSQIALNYLVAGHHGHNRLIDTAQKFLAICDSIHCTIIPSIHNVVLNIDTAISLSLFEQAVRALERASITRIVLVDHTSSLLRPMALSWIAPVFPDLQEFVYNALYHVAQDMPTLLASLPVLKVLSVYSIAPSAEIMSAIPPPVVFAHLHTLRLRLVAHDPVLSWLKSAAGTLRLETFDLNVFHSYHDGWGPVTALNALLRASSEHLRHLSLRITYDDTASVDDELRLAKASAGEVNLSALSNLRSLLLSSHHVEAICRALASLPDAPTLSTLEVDFVPWAYHDVVPCQCDAPVLVDQFADVMARSQFGPLARFVIRVPGFFGADGRDALREYFPRWKSSPVLAVDYVESSPAQVDLWKTRVDFLFGATGRSVL